MTATEFNEKYSSYKEERHYGCALHNPIAVKFLDWVFKTWTKYPRFKYSQIKLKFGRCYIYTTTAPADEVSDVENVINNIYSLVKTED